MKTSVKHNWTFLSIFLGTGTYYSWASSMKHFNKSPFLKTFPYNSKAIRGAEDIICKDDKIFIPETLQQRCMDWYNQNLRHPGKTRMKKTISQNSNWHGLKTHVRRYCKWYLKHQMVKRPRKKYEHVFSEDSEFIPLETVCIDCICPYKVRHKKIKTNGIF